MVALIEKKRNGLELDAADIDAFISALCSEEVTSAQTAAMLMAIYLQGMTLDETINLTRSMAQSGSIMDWTGLNGHVVDKHSTGGVGDKTSMVLVPWLASCGFKVAKLSGKALGHTGGTLDKLYCFQGINLDLSPAEMVQCLKQAGAFISGQTVDIVPADKILYALRDQTATVGSLPLIASSIMSKKIAGGAQFIILDVKVGSGAMMPDIHQAEELAKLMVLIGNALGSPTRAVLTDMDQPLGYTVGHYLEVAEAVETLRGDGPKDLLEICRILGTQLLDMAEIGQNTEERESLMQQKIKSGAALNKLKQMLRCQGGDTACLDETYEWQQSRKSVSVPAEQDGYITMLQAGKIGKVARDCAWNHGKLDLTAGIRIYRKVGDRVKAGEPILTISGHDSEKLSDAIEMIRSGIAYSATPVFKKSIIHKIID